MRNLEQWIEECESEISNIAERIFCYAETAEREKDSAKCLAEYLKKHDFQVEMGVGGMPTSLRAVWGSGKPCIGFLGEYDALPGLSQGCSPFYNGNEKEAGHGCGHNLLGTASAAAAVALRHVLEKEKIEGQVVFYGCPAEETLKGKNVMAGNGCFRELDAALSWHPSDGMNPGEISYSAMDSIQFTFLGKSSHAAAKPHLGRSSLDAVELMNVGANYMREHVADGVRFHYAHMDCGELPNIVPAKSRVWYFVRARSRSEANDVTDRLLDIARGAALMTGTTASWEFISQGSETLINHTMCRLIYKMMCDTKPPVYTEEAVQFAKKLAEASPDVTSNGEMNVSIPEPSGKIQYSCGSTDVSDVSHIIPTGYFKVTCLPAGIPLHSWMATACAGTELGQKGMMYAAKVLAKAGFSLITDRELLEKVKEEFKWQKK